MAGDAPPAAADANAATDAKAAADAKAAPPDAKADAEAKPATDTDAARAQAKAAKKDAAKRAKADTKKKAEAPEPEISPKQFIVPCLMMAAKFFKLDFSPYVDQLRAGFACACALTLSVHFLVKSIAAGKKDATELTVATKTWTVCDYDQAEALKKVKGALASVCIPLAMHYKWGSPMPLLFQCITQPMNLLGDPLVRIHLLGKKPEGELARPFKAAPNPLADLLGGGDDAGGAKKEKKKPPAALDSSMLILFVSLLVSACAVASALGFRGRVEVVGIDLGTTYSVVAVSEGRKGVRVFDDPSRGKLTASTVAFLKGGAVAVGAAAKAHAAKDPRHVLFDAKRFIGRDFDDESVALQAKKYTFEVVKDANSTGCAFALDVPGHPATATPVDVGAEVVKALMRTVHDDLGHENVKRAVIAVPASFGPAQIAATGDAFKAAGLKVVRVMPEPVAAAVAYGLHKKKDVNHVLVYDFGGGTLDVSILYVQDGSIEVVANGGDNDLGGTDFDQCVAEDLAADVAAQTGAGDSVARASGCEAREPLCARHVLASMGERLKIAVSDAASADAACLAPRESCDDLVRVEFAYTRKRFENACDHLFVRAIDTVARTLDEGMLTHRDIDEVVMVGGTSRVPRVRDTLRDHLRVDKLNTEIDPDVTVAVGAASILD